MLGNSHNNLDRIFLESSSPTEYAAKYLDYLATVFKSLDLASIEAFISELLAARERGSTIYFIGNGGSAATSSHFANDLLAGMRLAEKPFKAVALTDNTALITALGNDEGYEEIFSKQLQVLVRKNDLVVAISASGNSPNLLRAVGLANSMGAKTFGLLGFNGGALADLCAQSVIVRTPPKEYGPVEDLHMILDHLVTTYLYRAVRASEKTQKPLSVQPSALN